MSTDEPLYDGDDPFFQGETLRRAEHLQSLPQIPRTLDAVLPRILSHFRAELVVPLLDAAVDTPEWQRAFARCWRTALQHTSFVGTLDARRTEDPPERGALLEEVLPDVVAKLNARSPEEVAAQDKQRLTQSIEHTREKLRAGERYLTLLRELVRDEEFAQREARKVLQHETSRLEELEQS